MLALVAAGLPRQAAYEMVQRNALSALADERGRSFRERLLEDPEVGARLSPAALDGCFDLEHHLRHVDAIFARTLEADAAGGPT
jgi:adenylosuccinate lyase